MITVIALNETQVESVLELVQEQINELRSGEIAVQNVEDEIRHLEEIITAVHAGDRQEPTLFRRVTDARGTAL